MEEKKEIIKETSKEEEGKMQTSIDKKTMIGVIVRKHPETAPIFARYGMGCVTCSLGQMETVEAAAKEHGVDLIAFLKDLNQAILKK